MPGAEKLSIKRKDNSTRDFTKNPLHIFYAACIYEHYRLEELFKAVARTEHCVMTLCSREQEWLKKRGNGAVHERKKSMLFISAAMNWNLITRKQISDRCFTRTMII